MATCRFRFVSVARYTSPIPPTPSRETTSYGPTCVPGLNTGSLADPALSEVEGLGISPAGSRSAHARKAAQSRTGPGENPFRVTLVSLEAD